MSDTPPTGGKRAVATDEVVATGGQIVMRHKESDGIAIVSKRAFDNSWRNRGWEEVDTEKEKTSLRKQAEDMGVNLPENVTGIRIVESILAYRHENREV